MVSKRSIALFLMALSFWLLGGSTLYGSLTERSNSAHLQDRAQQLISRIEKALDFVVTAQAELLIAGHASCSADAIHALGKMALRTGTVSEIYMITPAGTCSGFQGLSSPLPDAAERATWRPALNPAYRVGAIETAELRALGVSWGFQTGTELVMKISPEALLIDVLPTALRQDGETTLSVGESVAAEIARVGATTAVDVSSFTAAGERYPVAVEVVVATDALSQWRSAAPTHLLLGWVVFGFIFAAIFVRAVVPRDHREVASISKALSAREIIPHFQPIVDLRDGAVIGCEALARWIKPNGERISPARFIPLIERNDLSDQLFEVMFRETAQTLGPHLERHPGFRVGFNVTPDQFLKPGFPQRVELLATECAVSTDHICIEVTERQALSSPEKAALVTAELSRLGVSVAIDDAGTGHNGLAAMQQLSANSLKLDKFFVDHVHSDPRSRAMVDMLVAVSQKYAMTIVAEGVELAEQVRALQAAGVKSAQGYFFSRPVPADEMIAFLPWVFELEASSAGVSVDASPKTTPTPTEDVDETARVAALHRYQILDTPEEESFERIPRIIKSALQAPMAAIAFIDEDRRWFKAVAGGKRGELPRSVSFCNRTIQSDEPTVVVDTHLDSAFRENRLVVEPPHIRAYLGVPLVTPDGYRVGSVCCVDKKPREFSSADIQLVKDLSSIAIEQLELRQMALFDSLTSVLSRRGFRAEAEIQLAVARRLRHGFSVLALDIDYFKSINDGFGHAIGDEVLIELGARLSRALRDQDFVGRMGGEEFAVALPETDHAVALIQADRIRKAVADAPFETQAGPIDIRVSIGVATLDQSTADLDGVLKAADLALYRAKRDGRNCVRDAVSKVA